METLDHVLIVDDDPNKLAQLRAYFETDWRCRKLEVRHSFQSGLKYALLESPGLIILDMTMPTYDVHGSERGGRERRYAGEEILRRLQRRQKATSAIVVTQFEQFGEGPDLVTLEELKDRLSRMYSALYLGAVWYQAADARWKDQLRLLLTKFKEEASKRGYA